LIFKPLYIIRLAMVVLLPMLLALAPAMAMTVVYKGKTAPLSVVEVPSNTYEWEIYTDTPVDFAKVPGNCPATSAKFIGGNYGSKVAVQWLEVGIYFFKVTARDALGCTMNLKVGMVKVIPAEIEAIIAGAAFTGACQQVKLDASTSIGDIIKYEWSMIDKGGALTRPTGKTTEFLLSPSFAGTLPADFRVKLLITDRKGNTNSAIVTINVDQLPVAEIYASGKLEKDGSMIVDGAVSTGIVMNYRWFTSEGKIVGPTDQPTAKLNGAGIYTLEITDNHGCKSLKSFRFPFEIRQAIYATNDFARTSWAKDTTILVLGNDGPPLDLVPGTVRITDPATRGTTKVNPDGSITYSPTERRPGSDQFVYTVCDALNYCTSATVTVLTYSAGITAPEGFSPNGDGLNEKFVFKGLENYPKSQLYIFTRSGQLVYQNEIGYENDWNGTTIKSTMTNLELVPTGTYYYVLKLGVHDIGDTNRSLKGFVYIAY